MLIHSRVVQRDNKNGSVVYYARIPGDNGDTPQYLRLCKTEPKPTKTSLKAWQRKAQELLADIEQHRRDALEPWVTPLTHVSLAHAWRVYVETNDGEYAQSSVDRKARVIRAFVDLMGDRWPDRRSVYSVCWQPTFIAAYIAKRRAEGAAEATLAGEQSDLMVWLQWCRERNYTDRLPEVPKISLPPSRIMLVPSTSVVRDCLKGQRNDAYRTVLTTLALTGLRTGELMGLPLTAWDNARAVLAIPPSRRPRTKGHERILPIGDRLALMLRTHMQGHPVGTRHLVKLGVGFPGVALNRAMKPWKITPHDLRRWFNAQLPKVGCEPLMGDYLMGHAPSKLARSYPTAFSADDLRPVMVAVERQLIE